MDHFWRGVKLEYQWGNKFYTPPKIDIMEYLEDIKLDYQWGNEFYTPPKTGIMELFWRGVKLEYQWGNTILNPCARSAQEKKLGFYKGKWTKSGPKRAFRGLNIGV